MPAFTSYTILNVNEGTVPNDGTGDPLRSAFDKVNNNFSNVANFLQQSTVDFPSANITVGNVGNVTVGNVVGNLNVNGFLTVTRDVRITGNLVVANTVSINNQQLFTMDPLVQFDTSSSFPYNYDIGFYSRFRGGPANVEAYTGVVRRQTNNQWTFFSNVQTVPTANDIAFSDVGIRYDTIYAGNLILANTQQAASNFTGVLVVSGGAGIAGNLWAGNIYSGNARVLTTASAGVGNVFSGGIVTGNTLFTAATVSTSATSGAILVPNGGIGVGANSFFGGNITVVGNIISTGTISSLGTLTGLTVASTGTISIGTTSISQNTIGVTNITAPSGVVNFTSANVNFTSATLFNVGNIGAAGVNAVLYGPQFVAAAAGDVSYFPMLSNVSTGIGTVSAGGDFSFNPTRDLVTVPNLNGTGNIAVANFSAANAVVLGATTYIGTAATQIANIRAVEGRFNNLSSANVFLSGGYATGLANVRATELQTTNFSTGNALLSGSTVATNFSTGNALLSGTSVATNFSTGNIRITGGFADNFPIGANTAAPGTFANLTVNTNATGQARIVAAAAPTIDQFIITNAGFPAVTAGTSAMQIDYVGGAAAVEASASRINLTPGATTGGTWNGFRTVVGTDATTGVTLNGFKLDTIASPGAGTSNAMFVGTGWDNIINYNTASIISGTGAVASQGNLTATGNIGYAVGSGGTQTQATSKATAVVLSRYTGRITTTADALAPNVSVSFTLTNTFIAPTDMILLNHVSGGSQGAYGLAATPAQGSANITIRNNTTFFTLSEAIVIQYAIIKTPVA
jgi:hypothetical protein